MIEWLFLAVPQGCLRFVIVVFPDRTHLLFLKRLKSVFFPQEKEVAQIAQPQVDIEVHGEKFHTILHLFVRSPLG